MVKKRSEEEAIVRFAKEHPDIIQRFIKAVLVTRNRNRLEILELLHKHKELNLTQISEKVGIAYQNVLPHIKKLKEAGLVEVEKKEKSQGREVLVRITSEMVEIYEDTLKKIK
jgi:DNA-binding transcriptional ArsR family regulator